MGSLFKTPKNKAYPTGSSEQRALFGPLSEFFLGEIGQEDPNIRTLIDRLMGSTTQESQNMAERMFTEGLMGPAMRNFDQQVQPRIASGFARYGATMGSRRGQTIADALTTVQTDAQGQIARMLPEIYSFPVRNTLAQIQGLGELQRQRYTPYQSAMQFALQPTQSIQQTAAGPGWGLLNSAIGAAGFLGGAALAPATGGLSLGLSAASAIPYASRAGG